MKCKIGFNTGMTEVSATEAEAATSGRSISPVPSLVQVFFPERHTALAYYNDTFDLRRGDIVYVDGKLAGLQGRVVDVSLRFKIRISDYRRVIGLADTEVHGTFQPAGSYLLTFDPAALPFEKVITWYKPPVGAEEEYAAGDDGASFHLDDLSGMKADAPIIERGEKYYREDRVVYLSIRGTRGRAIVEGTQPYELEFEYADGEIRDLVCSCFCSGTCKHEVAAMLQLRESLALAERCCPGGFAASGALTAITKIAFFSFVIDSRESGSITV